MTDPSLFRLRVEYRKQGRLALLSHLEVARALERTVRRAGLPFAVSQGFSPHMRIAFGAALPVGIGGECELFDLLLVRYVPADAALEALRAASVPDLMALSCRYIEHTAPAASVAFPVSTYEAELSCAPDSLPVPAQVSVVHKKKERTLEVEEFLVGRPRLAGRLLTFELEAKPSGSLRPDVLVCRMCAGAAGQDVGPVAFCVPNEAPADGPASTDADGPAVRAITRVSQREDAGAP